MADGASRRVHTLPLAEAARWLGVDEGAIRSLVEAKYLNIIDGEIPLADVRAFQARNAEGGSGAAMGIAVQSTDVQALIDALDSRVDELASATCEQFVGAIPETAQWSEKQRNNFIAQAKGRLGAILAVTEHGAEVDDALRRDLEEVGANAAWAGSSLEHLQLVLRISRNVLLHTALRISAEGQGRWNVILDSFIERMLSAIDHLTDALSMGFWRAQVDRHQEEHHRLANLLDRSPYGVYEVDMDGRLQYANPAFAAIAGRPGDDLEGLTLADVLHVAEGSLAALLAEPDGDVAQVSLVVRQGDEGRATFDIDTVVRRVDGSVVGFAGIVRQAAGPGAVDLTPLIRHIHELRRSIEILTDAGGFLARHAAEMSADQVEQAGTSVQRQAERLMIIVDELDDDRKSLQPPA